MCHVQQQVQAGDDKEWIASAIVGICPMQRVMKSECAIHMELRCGEEFRRRVEAILIIRG
jgi:hypothetical protein